MKNRGRNRRRLGGGRSHPMITGLRAAIACATAVLVVAGCGTITQGRALSMLNDPFRVGDLPATNGPSGIRPNAPAPNGTVVNTDNGQIDKLSLLSVNDIEDYWKSVYSQSLKGTFLPVGKLVSYDSNESEQSDRLPQRHLQARQRLFHLALQLDRLGSRRYSCPSRNAISATCPSPVCWHTSSDTPCSRWRNW